MFDLRLYLVTDSQLSLDRPLTWIVQEAVAGGITMVQLREKNCPTREFVERAAEIKKILAPYGVPLIINDRLDVALAVDAEGLHLGQSDMPYHTARKLFGKHKIIGLSIESVEQVVKSNYFDVDYIGISPVFGTLTKTDTAPPFGLKGVAEVKRISKHPAVAIGGISANNAKEIMRAGADSIAVVSAICSADSPRDAANRLLKETYL